MHIEDLKFWHWLVVGVVVGDALAGVQAFYGSTPPGTGLNPAQFDAYLLNRPIALTGDRVPRDYAYLENLVVHPPQRDERGQMITVVSGTLHHSFKRDRQDAQNNIAHVQRIEEGPFVCHTASPYVPDKPHDWLARTPWDRKPAAGFDAAKVAGPHATVVEYLEKLQLKYGQDAISYRGFAWWERPVAVSVLWGGGGFVAVGLLFPLMMHLLVTAGFGRRASEKGYDLSRQPSKIPSKTANKSAKMTEGDLARLTALEEDLERRLAEAAERDAATAPTPAVAVAAAPPPPPKLTVGPPATETQPKPHPAAPAKAFGAEGGDYYPTEIHGGRSEKSNEKST